MWVKDTTDKKCTVNAYQRVGITKLFTFHYLGGVWFARRACVHVHANISERKLREILGCLLFGAYRKVARQNQMASLDPMMS